MPERIKPRHDFGPVVVTRETIRKITERFDAEFDDRSFAASHGVWEIYGASGDELLRSIAQRKQLDSFDAEGIAATQDEPRTVNLRLNNGEASLTCSLNPGDEEWLDDLVFDLKRWFKRPRLAQRLGVVAERGSGMTFEVLGMIASFSVGADKVPYALIELEKSPRSPLLENIKANLISNVIWAFLGAAVLFILQLLAKRFHLIDKLLP